MNQTLRLYLTIVLQKESLPEMDHRVVKMFIYNFC
jgi:hypothetical protein